MGSFYSFFPSWFWPSIFVLVYICLIIVVLGCFYFFVTDLVDDIEIASTAGGNATTSARPATIRRIIVYLNNFFDNLVFSL